MKIQPAAGDAVPVLKLYYQRIKSSRLPETAVPVLKLYYQRMKIQPAARDGRSSINAVLPEKENAAGRRTRRFQYYQYIKLYYQKMKIHPAAGDGRSSTKVVLREIKKPAGRWGRPFRY